MKITRTYLKDLIYRVNGLAIEVHKSLGPGLLESTYHQCMIYELKSKNINFVSELDIPIRYKETVLDSKLRCDLVVENFLVVELKSVAELQPIFQAQLLTYMNLLKLPIGVMYNFNVKNIYHEGQLTLVNEFFKSIPD